MPARSDVTNFGLATARCVWCQTLAFDFSVEEFWVPLVAGATLVASRTDVQLVSHALERFLIDHKITALCCVSTLLARQDSQDHMGLPCN